MIFTPNKLVKVKMEPKQSQHAGDAAVKKQVKIKLEPTIMKDTTKTKKLSPVTPVEKTTKPVQKPLERNNVDLSSKFFLPQLDDDLDIETPTRKRSGSKGYDAKLKKKQKVEEAIALTKSLSAVVPQSTSTPEKVKSNPSEKSVTPLPEVQVEVVPVTPPPPFKSINTSLLDQIKDGSFFDQAFKNIEEASLRGEYIHVASKTFDQWVSHGVYLVDKKHELVKKFIVERVKLDTKFKVIFAAVNQYNQNLESRDDELKKKLNKLQSVGQEIKDLINC